MPHGQAHLALEPISEIIWPTVDQRSGHRRAHAVRVGQRTIDKSSDAAHDCRYLRAYTYSSHPVPNSPSLKPPRVKARTRENPRLLMKRSVRAGEMDSYGQPPSQS